jgi:hypothetical protein
MDTNQIQDFFCMADLPSIIDGYKGTDDQGAYVADIQAEADSFGFSLTTRQIADFLNAQTRHA